MSVQHQCLVHLHDDENLAASAQWVEAGPTTWLALGHDVTIFGSRPEVEAFLRDVLAVVEAAGVPVGPTGAGVSPIGDSAVSPMGDVAGAR
jgi:hypothetical protein